MTTNLSYTDGDGWTTETSDQKSALVAAMTAGIQALKADKTTQGAGAADIYLPLLNLISTKTQIFDPMTGVITTVTTPLPGVDPSIYAWVSAA